MGAHRAGHRHPPGLADVAGLAQRAHVAGDTAWVTLNENILQGTGEGEGTLYDATVAAVNVFVRGDGGWRMVVHHGSPVSRPDE